MTPPRIDPRAEKTRSALMKAFNALLLSRGYSAISPAAVAEAAGVARSTLYEHFAGKEDMLRHSLSPFLAPLAECVGSAEPPPRLEFVLDHVRSSRGMARALLSGRARIIALRALAELIEARLAHVPACRTRLPRTLSAAYLAGGILGVLDEWVSGREACSVPVLAAALRASTAAVAGAVDSAASTGREAFRSPAGA